MGSFRVLMSRLYIPVIHFGGHVLVHIIAHGRVDHLKLAGFAHDLGPAR